MALRDRFVANVDKKLLAKIDSENVESVRAANEELVRLNEGYYDKKVESPSKPKRFSFATVNSVGDGKLRCAWQTPSGLGEATAELWNEL